MEEVCNTFFPHSLILALFSSLGVFKCLWLPAVTSFFGKNDYKPCSNQEIFLDLFYCYIIRLSQIFWINDILKTQVITACKTCGVIWVIVRLKGETISFLGGQSSSRYWLFHSLNGFDNMSVFSYDVKVSVA